MVSALSERLVSRLSHYGGVVLNIKLKNIGIIKESKVAIDGITVITGKNNSGKSTFGKAIFSVFCTFENLYENATADISRYAQDSLTKAVRSSVFGYVPRLRRMADDKERESDKTTEILERICNKEYPKVNSLADMIKIVDTVANVFEQIDNEYFKKITKFRVRTSKSENDLSVELENETSRILQKCEQIKETIDKYSDFTEYEERKILNTLLLEFKGQIPPQKIEEITTSEIIIEESDSEYSVSTDIKELSCKCKGNLLLSNTEINVIFIDDVTVLEFASPRAMFWNDEYFDDDELFSLVRAINHNDLVLNKLGKQGTITESIEKEKAFRSIEEKINTVISDNIVIKGGKYVLSSDGLNLTNLAMGSKIFMIIKTLLKNGCIDKNTILILDEPEAHLHPEWQNIFAEIVAMLVNEIGVKVVLTSHSPNFVLAIQTFSMQYKLKEKTNFYITKRDEDGYRVDYSLVKNMNEVYADFAKFFSQIKSQYDILKYGDYDD